jgi:hypothetical protein
VGGQELRKAVEEAERATEGEVLEWFAQLMNEKIFALDALIRSKAPVTRPQDGEKKGKKAKGKGKKKAGRDDDDTSMGTSASRASRASRGSGQDGEGSGAQDESGKPDADSMALSEPPSPAVTAQDVARQLMSRRRS